MTRSRRRKLQLKPAAPRTRSMGPPLTVACAVLAALPATSRAEDAAPAAALEEVVVTAQKRQESLQNVPLSIQALGNARLEQLHVQDFADYARMLPSVSFQGGGQGFGPGFSRVYMRGVAAGDNGNHSGPRPSVGMYLDEQPVTTIQGALDIHVYDIARVESLAGPQGTLYGASSQAGTVRLITNKPDPSAFKAGYDLEGSYTQHGAGGYLGEGFVNLPISSNMALRVVGWTEHQPGYIDNVHGTLTYPSTDITIDNTARVRKHYNDTDTTGARAALKVDLNDSWTVTPAIMGQDTRTRGSFGYDPSLGDLKIAHFHPESTADRWYQAALTVEGKISNFDLVYAGAYLHRHDETQQDYADYSFFYDSCCSYFSSDYVFDNAGNAIDPTQYIYGRDGYRSQSHELRISSPKDWRLRFVAGLFYQRQQHDIEQRYAINNLATSLEVTYWPDTWWLTEQRRVDRDTAAFTELNFDVTDKLVLTAGIRFFEAKNSLKGFFGFGKTNGFTTIGTGEQSCFSSVRLNGGPCTNLDRQVTESGNTPKINLSYKLSPDHMVYATWSKGFRPGGSNRREIDPKGRRLSPYSADFLENYEIGWKTSWLENSLRFNGAVFQENWKDFQFGYLGANALTEIRNAGAAKIRGVEGTLEWAATHALNISAGATFIDAKLTTDFCKILDAAGTPLPRSSCPADSFAPDGTRLPVTPRIKGNVSGRYSFAVAGHESYVQGTVSYQASAPATLIPNERRFLVDQRGYAIADLSAGFEGDGWTVGLFVSNLFDKRADLYRFAQCPVFQPGTGDTTPQSATLLCGGRTYIQTTMPRTIGLRFGQKF
jgi:outer membrane receptor protein involved in Fe transport